jgi:hypothetical protein
MVDGRMLLVKWPPAFVAGDGTDVADDDMDTPRWDGELLIGELFSTSC